MRKSINNEAIYNVSEEFREFYRTIINEQSVHVDEATFPRMTASMTWDHQQEIINELKSALSDVIWAAESGLKSAAITLNTNIAAAKRVSEEYGEERNER